MQHRNLPVNIYFSENEEKNSNESHVYDGQEEEEELEQRMSWILQVHDKSATCLFIYLCIIPNMFLNLYYRSG